ncbi:MAG: SpoIIE family protein phosphatase [Leptonema sp. (in: bacteria)]
MLELLNQFHVYLNFLSFGSMLAASFAFFFFTFLITIKDKSPYTVALAKTSFYQGFFYIGYFISAMFYHPLAAEHRLLTVGFIYPALIYFLQFVFLLPENTWPKVQKAFLYAQWIVGLLLLGIFFYITRNADFKFHFTGHYWDYDAEFISKIVAYFIMLYIFLTPIVSIIKIIHYRKVKKYRNALILYMITMLIGTVAPGILNTLSRDGVVERGIFLNVLVISVVTMLFILSVLYINITEDRTTFMAKIIGITLVTFLLLMQGLAYITLGDKEKEYDLLQVEYVEKSIVAKEFHPNLVYLYKYDLDTKEADYIYTREDYFKTEEKNKVDFDKYIHDLENVAIYEKIKNLPATNFKKSLLTLLEKTPKSFGGYKKNIENFINQYSGSELQLKDEILLYLDKLNQLTFVNYNRISFLHNQDFRKEIIQYLNKAKPEFAPFGEMIKEMLKNTQENDGKVLKKNVYAILAPLKPHKVRMYRSSIDHFTHYIAFTKFDNKKNIIYEGGYRYLDYRIFMHKPAGQQTFIFLIIFLVITGFYPLFFRGSLIRPLDELLKGVKNVNQGDLTVKVPVYVQDEIGYLSTSFNKMVVSIKEAKDQLQDYANNLEEKVKERTAELNASLEEVRRLKQQQDGDYYLTSLLLKPLTVNFNKSKRVPTNFFVKQYKEFEFRGKTSEIGGDICVTGTLRLGKSLETAKRYIVAMNGDAMGKSTQGAGGALVMGVVMNSIIARSARHDRVLDMSPEQWLTDIYEEIHGVFSAFNGTMCISCVIDLIDEETGMMYYFNAEHPFQILYRNGKASFIEEELTLRKLGLESEYPFKVNSIQLKEGDIVIAGSDGRDDIQIETGESGIRIINENEFLILEIVEESQGDINKILEGIKKRGKLTDDISLLSISYVPTKREAKEEEDKKFEEDSFVIRNQERDSLNLEKKAIIVLDEENVESILEESIEGNFSEYLKKGDEFLYNQNYTEALNYYQKAYELNKNNKDLNKKLAVLTFKMEDYEKAVEVLEKYLHEDPYIEDFWLYLSIAHKRVGNLEKALETVEKAYELNSQRVPILLQLADVHFKLNHIGRASIFLDKVLELDPLNEQAKRLKRKIEEKKEKII